MMPAGPLSRYPLRAASEPSRASVPHPVDPSGVAPVFVLGKPAALGQECSRCACSAAKTNSPSMARCLPWSLYACGLVGY